MSQNVSFCFKLFQICLKLVSNYLGLSQKAQNVSERIEMSTNVAKIMKYLKAMWEVKGNSNPLLKTFFISNFGFDALSGFSGKWNIARKFVSYAKSTNSFSIEIANGQPKLSTVRIFDFSSILCFDFEYRQMPTTESKSADKTNCALLKNVLTFAEKVTN